MAATGTPLTAPASLRYDRTWPAGAVPRRQTMSRLAEPAPATDGAAAGRRPASHGWLALVLAVADCPVCRRRPRSPGVPAGCWATPHPGGLFAGCRRLPRLSPAAPLPGRTGRLLGDPSSWWLVCRMSPTAPSVAGGPAPRAYRQAAGRPLILVACLQDVADCPVCRRRPRSPGVPAGCWATPHPGGLFAGCRRLPRLSPAAPLPGRTGRLLGDPSSWWLVCRMFRVRSPKRIFFRFGFCVLLVSYVFMLG